ncbi:MAG: hypothetical protein Q9165_003076 [Trypethelium subeluteriae]
MGEYAKASLENTHLLDEKQLLGQLGYAIEDLAYLARLGIPYGGLRSIGVQAGETVLIAPATGGFSGATVELASAMGAGRIIAAGRNLTTLQRLKANIPRVEIIQLTGNVDEDAKAMQQWGQPTAYIDFTPTGATDPVHIASGVKALSRNGRVVLNGGAAVDVAVPYFMVMKKNITIKGQFMYSGDNIRDLIKMAETGIVKLGKGAGLETIGRHSLDEWEVAFDEAEVNSAWGKQAVIIP